MAQHLLVRWHRQTVQSGKNNPDVIQESLLINDITFVYEKFCVLCLWVNSAVHEGLVTEI